MTRKSTINRTVFLLFPLFGVSSGKLCVTISRVFWIITLAFIKYCHFRYFLAHLTPENFFNLIDCLSSFLAHVKVIAKLVAFWINEQKLMKILELITDDWNDFANNDTNIRTMTRKAKTSARITNGMVILHTVAIVAYCLGVITEGADVTDQTTELPYFNKLDLPFSVTTQHMYRLVLMSEFLHLILSNCLAGVTNAILLSLVLHVSGQIEILQCWLEQLTIKDIENRQQSIVIRTKKIILKHQKIISFTETIEYIYTYIALILFASNSMLICSISFLIVAAIGTDDAVEQIIKCVLFFTLTNLEAFIFCYAGEYLKTKSKAIEFATYSCAWYNLKPKDSRVLLLIISRSQKQLTLTAGKMMDLNLESFASIMNASGSYLSVLLAMQ